MAYLYNDETKKLVDDITNTPIDINNPFSIEAQRLWSLKRRGCQSYILPDGKLPPYEDFLIRSYSGCVADDKDFDFNVYEAVLAEYLNPWFRVSYDEYYKPFADGGIEFTERRRKNLKGFNPKKKEHGLLYGSVSSWGFSDTKVLEIIYEFLWNIYKNESFVKGMNYPLFESLIKPIEEHEKDARYRFESLNEAMYRFLRDLLIMYMGFHGLWILPDNFKVGPYQKFIFTSEIHANEKFYNYLLNDFSIARCPKMIWNENEKRYEKIDERLSPFVQRKENEIMEEVSAIKRLVPSNERYKYYR